jgi:hypothetical protein
VLQQLACKMARIILSCVTQMGKSEVSCFPTWNDGVESFAHRLLKCVHVSISNITEECRANRSHVLTLSRTRAYIRGCPDTNSKSKFPERVNSTRSGGFPFSQSYPLFPLLIMASHWLNILLSGNITFQSFNFTFQSSR